MVLAQLYLQYILLKHNWTLKQLRNFWNSVLTSVEQTHPQKFATNLIVELDAPTCFDI